MNISQKFVNCLSNCSPYKCNSQPHDKFYIQSRDKDHATKWYHTVASSAQGTLSLSPAATLTNLLYVFVKKITSI